MARPNSKGLELTFHAPSKRWCKVIEGRRHYFGQGRSRSDRVGYQSALVRFHCFKAERQRQLDAQEQREANDQLGVLVTNALQLMKRQLPSSTQGLFRQFMTDIAKHDELTIVDDETNTEAHFHRVDGHAIRPPKQSLRAMLDEFEAVQRDRFDRTRSDPEAVPRGQRLGGSAFRNLTYSIRTLRTHLETAGLDDANDMVRLERELLRLRADLDKKISLGKMAASTAHTLTKCVRPFFQWAWMQRRIPEVPRCLMQVTRKTAVKPSAKPLDVEQIRQAWRAADERLKCWMALGLNCGFYAMDIATLKPEHLSPDGKYIVRYRNKTHVPTKHLLWPLTARLIAACRTDRAGLLFNRKGSLALVVEHPNDGKKYDSIANRLRRVSGIAGAVITFSQLRDTSADLIERIGATGAGMIDRALVDQFLGHADSRMAKHYITSNPIELETTKLDNAIRKLEQTYALDA